MINVDDLLKPVSDDKPCGEDFTYHPTLQNLETIVRGKQKSQFDSEDKPDWEEPDWQEVRDAALEVLGQSKHLTAGVILAVSLLKLDGVGGLRDGLAVVHGLVEKFWADAYPRLDPEDNNDPTERLNILNNLASTREPYRFALHLRQAVLCESPAMGRITLEQALTAKEKAAGGSGGASSAELNQVQAAFRDAGPEAAQKTLALVSEAIDHARGIDTFLDTTLGSGNGVNLDALHKLLGEMSHAIQPYAGGDAPAGGATGESTEGDGAATGAGEGGGRVAARSGPAVSGTIQTRGDVIKALDLICDYYRENEPSSPVPLILQRAQRLVAKDFMEIMSDLTPDALSQLQIITGKKKDGEG